MEKMTKKIKKKASSKEEKIIDESTSVKKKNVDKEETNMQNKKFGTIREFINKPLPLIIVLIVICAVQLFFLFNINSKIAIYTGELNNDEVQIANLHLFTNNDMNYFYASPAAYIGEDKDVYSFEIGYYIKMSEGEYLPFTTRSRELENASSLKEIIEEMSAWNFYETSVQDYFFSDEVLKNLDDLHFMVKASTTKGNSNADVVINYPIEVHKITK